MTIPSQFGFYGILTAPLKGYEYLTEVLVEWRVPFIQLRMKEEPLGEVYRMAERLRTLTAGTDSRLIIDDYPRIARDTGADGVHVGQGDMSYREARAIVGQNAIVGISTHSLLQTERACALEPGYIGVGPVFATPTKKNPDAVIGLDGMADMLALSRVPAVAIGGIDLTNIRGVLEAGARNICMVRQLTQSDSPNKVLKEICAVYNEYYPGILGTS